MIKRVGDLIDHFGSQALTAKALGVSQATVSYWRSGALKIRPDKAFLAELITGGEILASDLCDLLAQIEARRNVSQSSISSPCRSPGHDGSVHPSSAGGAE